MQAWAADTECVIKYIFTRSGLIVNRVAEEEVDEDVVEEGEVVAGEVVAGKRIESALTESKNTTSDSRSTITVSWEYLMRKEAHSGMH